MVLLGNILFFSFFQASLYFFTCNIPVLQRVLNSARKHLGKRPLMEPLKERGAAGIRDVLEAMTRQLQVMMYRTASKK